MLDAQDNLSIVEGEVASLIFDGQTVSGITLADESQITDSGCHISDRNVPERQAVPGRRNSGWRAGPVKPVPSPSVRQIRDAGLPIARLKTGTPPRIDGRTIDWATLPEQPSDDDDWTMSPMSLRRDVPQIFCAVSRTSAATHDIIRDNLDRSPLFSGAIDAQGPRYCPSIEDKIHRFADRDSHQVFLEPEGLDTNLVYPNGISTSLPADVQEAFVRTMDGLSKAEIIVPGYAVEYDHIDPARFGSVVEGSGPRWPLLCRPDQRHDGI